VQGTVLILDGVATSRIMLRVQLSAAYYRVVQATALAGVAELVRRTRPDVIACAMNLPDGDAITLRQRLRHDPDLDAIPVIAITEENDRHARIRALEAT
jgi:two-component system cell cycle response regulator